MSLPDLGTALRFRAAELMMRAKVPYDVMAERMGHANLATTYAHYRNVSAQRHEDAAERIEAVLG